MQQMVLNAIRFLLSSLIASIETIVSNFQQKFVLVGVFNILPLNFSPEKVLVSLKSVSKSSFSWQGKRDVFLLELYLAINPSILASENDFAQLAELL